jgi:uncharacterized alkaline shock family protein YloU
MTELAHTDLGRIAVSPAALQRVVVRTAEQIDGVRVRRQRRNPRVEVGRDSAHVTVGLAVRRGIVVPEAARAVQQRVADEVGSMLEVRVMGVDVSVEAIFQ